MHQALVTGPLEHPWWPLAGHTVPGGKAVGDPSVGCAQGSHPGPPCTGVGGTCQPPAAPRPRPPPAASVAPFTPLYDAGFSGHGLQTFRPCEIWREACESNQPLTWGGERPPCTRAGESRS